jgi:hypothetical protein
MDSRRSDLVELALKNVFAHAAVKDSDARALRIDLRNVCGELVFEIPLRVCVLREDQETSRRPYGNDSGCRLLANGWNLRAKIGANPFDDPSDSRVGVEPPFLSDLAHFVHERELALQGFRLAGGRRSRRGGHLRLFLFGDLLLAQIGSIIVGSGSFRQKREVLIRLLRFESLLDLTCE